MNSVEVVALPEDDTNALALQVRQAREQLGGKFHAQAEQLQKLEQDLKELRDVHVRQVREQLEEKFNAQAEQLQILEQDLKELRDQHVDQAREQLKEKFRAQAEQLQKLEQDLKELREVQVRQAQEQLEEKFRAQAEELQKLEQDLKELGDEHVRQAREQLGEKFRVQAELLEKFEQDLNELRDEHERLEFDAGRHFEALENFRLPSPPVSLEVVLAAMRNLLTATSPKQVLSRLTEEANRMEVRAAAFEVRGKAAWGASAHGFESRLTEKALRALVVPLTANTPFREVFENGRHFGGNPDGLKKNANVLNRFKPDSRDSILLLPVHSGGAVSAILYADSGGSGASLPEDALKLLAEFAAARLDHLLALSVKAKAAVRKEAAGGAQAEFMPSQEFAVAVAEAPVEAVVPGEAAASRAEASAPILAEPPPPPSAPAVIEAAAVEPPVAEVVTELPAAPQGETIAPSLAEAPPPPPAPAVIEAAAVEPPVAEVVTELPAEPQGETIAPSLAEAPPPPPTPVAIEAVGPVELLPAEASAELPAAPAPTEFAPALEPVAVPVVEAQTAVGVPSPPAPGAGFDISQLSEGEQKLHKAARRLAKVLVSEIELYNKTQAAEGRRSKDLYTRLKRDIERSRQTFERRYGKTVGKQFDYFHDELVRTLAGNDPSLLGSDYPGPSV